MSKSHFAVFLARCAHPVYFFKLQASSFKLQAVMADSSAAPFAAILVARSSTYVAHSSDANGPMDDVTAQYIIPVKIY